MATKKIKWVLPIAGGLENNILYNIKEGSGSLPRQAKPYIVILVEQRSTLVTDEWNRKCI
ncbi:hypothetical protein EZS27_016069 [termite gut metagenome]|uniref:Uncharacterized protein n=1 Tax=termite gut metagenome TaxID=433724 RepID=A0A5J4RRX2_9ZZZZ